MKLRLLRPCFLVAEAPALDGKDLRLKLGKRFGRIRYVAELRLDLASTGRGVFVPLVFPPGDAFQFDWSEDWAELAKVPAAQPLECQRRG